MSEGVKIYPLRDDKSSWSANPFIHSVRVYMNFLQFLFREDNSTGLIYRSDPKTSDLFILDSRTVNAEMVGPKPAITVTREAANMQAMTIGSVQSQNVDGSVIKRNEMIAFTLIANVISLHPVQVEELVWYIGSRTWLHMDILAQEGFFDVGTRCTMTAPGPATSLIEGDVGGYYVGRVIMPARALATYTITPVNYQRLKDLWVKFRDSAGKELLTIRADP